MKEIGSEFWDVPICDIENTLFSDVTQWFLSGRSALQAIISELENCHTVAMPSWCCDSMIKPFVDAGKEIHFYPVYFDKEFVQEISLDSDILFLMDYFGYSYPKPDLSMYSGVIIRDVTHSIFSTTHSDADYYFGSLRKWCGVWTGGYVRTKDGHKIEIKTECRADDYVLLRESAMRQKAAYMCNLRSDKEYLKVFDKAEEVLENIGIASECGRDVELIQKLDLEFIKARRRTNAGILRDELKDMLIFNNLKESDTPMFVPIFVPGGKRDELRRHLIKNEIYCPVHWPLSAYHRLDEQPEIIYKNELSLVCDQRYTEEDMYRIVDVIKQFWKEA